MTGARDAPRDDTSALQTLGRRFLLRGLVVGRPHGAELAFLQLLVEGRKRLQRLFEPRALAGAVLCEHRPWRGLPPGRPLLGGVDVAVEHAELLARLLLAREAFALGRRDERGALLL